MKSEVKGTATSKRLGNTVLDAAEIVQQASFYICSSKNFLKKLSS